MWNRSESQIELVFIRHGATKSNKEHRYIGKTDEPLSENGIREVQKLKQSGYYPKVEHLFCSPMKRCIETARLIYPDITCVIVEEWKEIDFGIFEGKNYVELQGNQQYQAWVESNGMLPFPEGESRETFDKRNDIGLHKVLQLLLQMEEVSLCKCLSMNETENLSGYKGTAKYITIGIIVHGGTIMSLLSRYGGGEYFDYQLNNGEGYQCRLKVGREGFNFTDIGSIACGPNIAGCEKGMVIKL